MSLNIRYWLASRQIELDQLSQPSTLVAGVAFRIVQDMESKSLTPFDICALAEVLELPLGAACLAIEPMNELIVWLLRLLSRKKPLKRNEGTWLTFQVAYLNALQGILEQESQLRRPWINRASVPTESAADQLEGSSVFEYPLGSVPPALTYQPRQFFPTLDDQQLIALLKTLRPGRLSDSQAEQALTMVGESFLVQQMNNTAVAWLVANGAEETEAKLIVQRLVHGLPGRLLAVIAENALPLAQLQKFVRLANLVGVQSVVGLQHDTASSEIAQQNSSENVENYILNTQKFPLNLHRENYRASLLQALSEPLLTEHFALKDLYVPLKGRVPQESLGSRGKGQMETLPSANLAMTAPVDLMEWVSAQLEDTTSIAAIEGAPGYGKTSFCQILAAHVAQELYPSWMPVLIRLKDATFGQTLEQTLDTAFPLARFTDRDGWLSLSSPPCLLILDGLDELPPSAHPRRHIEAFLDQLVQFQARHVASIEGTPRHKILLTCAPSTIRQEASGPRLQAIPHRLRRIVIQPMEQDEFRQWFQLWSKLQSKSIAQGYFSFLKQAGVFRTAPTLKDLAALVRQPLMLYLLGVLHRDGQLDDSIFHMDYTQLSFEIYDRICQWLLAYPDGGRTEQLYLVREGLAHACRSPEAIANLLQGLSPQDLRHQMQVAALTILQSGQHQVNLMVVQTRLREALSTSDAGVRLPAFFFRERNNFIEFSHPNLGQYLCAEEITAQLISLTRQRNDVYGEVSFVIQKPSEVAQHIYAMLGYGLLSTEIEEFVVERLRRFESRTLAGFSISVIFESLYRFYRDYCRGRWLDEGIAHQAHAQTSLATRSNPLNVLQVDATVGLNVFLLLCAIARVAQIPFWPCGDPSVPQEFNADQLLTLIGRLSVLSPTAFWQRMCYAQANRARASLSQVQCKSACLNYAMLAQANLWQANLSEAELIGTNLSEANLQEANLSWANLTGADLSRANLSGARLEGADLSGANLLGSNLTLANLTNACLFEAQLDEQNKKIASLNGAIFSLEEFHKLDKSLTRPKPTGGSKNRLTETNSTLHLVQSAEAEPVIAEYFHNEAAGDETVGLEHPAQGNPALPNKSESLFEGETLLLDDPPDEEI